MSWKYTEFISMINVPQNFQHVYRIDAPAIKNIIQWHQQFQETGCVDIKNIQVGKNISLKHGTHVYVYIA